MVLALLKNKNDQALAQGTKQVPFSQCQLWQQQKEFYHQQGIHAWAGKIPFYVTSNPYIADAYANIINHFMQETLAKKPHNSAPFYIVELGAGSGTFSFYLIKRLLELQQALNIQSLSFVYVMTDFTDSNIRAWCEHKALQTYVEQGLLDFAVYEAGQHSTHAVTLMQSGHVLTPEKLAGVDKNPLIVIANYIFDSIPHDIFQVQNNQLKLAIIDADAAIHDKKDNESIALADLKNNFEFCDVENTYYRNRQINAVLSQCVENYSDSYFPFPIGSLQCLKYWMEMAGNNLLVLASDKGYAAHFRLFKHYQPELTLHNAVFSMIVNFHAIGEYCKQFDGDYYFQSTVQDINSSVFIVGDKFSNLPQTQQAMRHYLDQAGPGNLYNIYTTIEEHRKTCSLATLIAHLNVMHWDPHIFNQCVEDIINKIEHASNAAIEDLRQGMEKIAANVYWLPKTTDTFVNIGIFFQTIGDYPSALHYYERSMESFGASETAYYNKGLCHCYLAQYSMALEALQLSLNLNKDNMLARGWISYIQDEIKKPP